MTLSPQIYSLKIVGLSFLFLSTFSYGASIEAPGKVFYKMSTGEIVKREVSLVVPAKGQGDVILKYAGKQAKAAKFWTAKKFGKTTFNVLFKDVPGAPKEWAALYTGAYLRGTNAALYYGDVYSIPKKAVDELLAVAPGTEALDLALDKAGRHYAGGFGFNAKIKP